MRSCRPLLTLAVLVFGCCGCKENLFRADDASDASSAEAVAATKTGPIEGTPEEVAGAVATAADRSQQRFGKLFEGVLPVLDQARERVDLHASLPDHSRLPFKADKQSNSAEINELLDQAIEILGVSEVTDYRQRIRDANAAISTSYANIADYRRQRISASWAKDQSQLEKVNPFDLSKEALDESIADETTEIKTQQKRLVDLKRSFAEELSKIGVEVDQEGVESLLSSVSGDDIVTMAVVFDNIKHVTAQLQQLTEESGEALDVSKKYYGMYVVMIHVMDRIQTTFVRDIHEKHIPKLNQFAAQAEQNIDQARVLIKIDGGDAKLLEANIVSNQLTRKTANLYIEYLQRNAEVIAAENKRAQKNLATAMNTYNTVKLSSDVAALMNTGRRDFEALMKLQVPALREFNNAAIRKEFQRMTSELRSGG
ncbi:hypothetical protein [Novipirellula artificiosorum]|uniref:Uncharacterized protein n=1 Tax=Novipirellula artificiosorum TaxID=2528016 RepID=A0A5C6D857_9BACT|nr:hypothetical protein [Novipirellula artificiosorum]TWU32024.1 hypothetical protein Poly41_59120 [Novipirellula artificiosorum]